MKLLYCSNCGTRLTITRKALPNYGVIVDIVNYHECPEVPIEFDLKPLDTSTIKPLEGKDKFVKSLNELSPLTPRSIISEGTESIKSPFGAVSSNDLRDRRFELSEPKLDIKTTAPSNVLDILKSIENGE